MGRASLRCVAVVAAIAAVAAVFDWLRVPNSGASLALRGLAFYLIAHWICRSETSSLNRTKAALATAAAIGAGAVSWQAGLPGLPVRAQWVAGIACAALVEELVFRVMLPRKLLEIFSGWTRARARTTAIVLSQGTFAAAHFTAGAPSVSDSVRFVRLLASGLALLAVLHVLGISMATSLHTMVNVFCAAATVAALTGCPPAVVLWSAGIACCIARAGSLYEASRSDRLDRSIDTCTLYT